MARIACRSVKIRTFPQLEQPVSNPTTGYRQDSWYFNYVSSEFANLYNLYINRTNQLGLKILNICINYLPTTKKEYIPIQRLVTQLNTTVRNVVSLDVRLSSLLSLPAHPYTIPRLIVERSDLLSPIVVCFAHFHIQVIFPPVSVIMKPSKPGVR